MSYSHAICLITLVALTLRVGCTAFFVGLNAPPKVEANPDQLDYDVFAWRMATGKGYSWENGQPTAARPPGTSFTLLPVYWLFGHSYLAARLWFCLLSALTCTAIAWAATYSFGPAVALLAALGLAIYPGHFYYSMHLLSEIPYTLWLALGVGCAVRALDRAGGRRYAFATGVCWALAALARPQIILAVPVAIVCVLCLWRRRRAGQATVYALMAIGMMIALAPWLIRNNMVFGRPALSTLNGGYTFWGANNELVLNNPKIRGFWVPVADLLDADHPLTGAEPERDAAAYRYARVFLQEHWRQVPQLCVYKLWWLVKPFEETQNKAVYWAFALSWLVLAPLALVGIVPAVRWKPLAALVFCVPILATIAAVLAFHGSIRFRDSLTPVLMVFAAATLVRLRGRGELEASVSGVRMSRK